jgi:hypothetical protein
MTTRKFVMRSNRKIDSESIKELNAIGKHTFPQNKKETTQLYNNVKTIIKNIIMEAIETNSCKPNDVLFIIDNGNSSDKKNPPYLNLKNGKEWSEERTLKQYLHKTSYNKGNIPRNVMSQTIRYSHSDPDIPDSEKITEIGDDDLFHPVIPNRLIVNNTPAEQYVILSRIFPDDKEFLANINNAVKNHNPNYFIEICLVQGDSSTIKVNGHHLNLTNEYYKLILREKSTTEQHNDTATVSTASTVSNSVIIYEV